ncbi:MAG: spore cortex biosynthesis protein YabQ [Caldicoprobacterales bacterium]|jgi:spore cortex biosynthesis protein YabQ|nr:spore cortex biosynthesis protein YabQ [Clostridiales bacterium]
MLSTSHQAYVFLSTVYAGFIIGFLYDCCRMVRKMIRAGKIITGLLDLLFWAVIGLFSFLLLFYINNGTVRFYTIFGFVIGWILYIVILSSFVMKILNWIYETLAKIIKWIMRILLWPFRMLYRFCLPVFKWAENLFKKAREDVRRKFLNCRKETIKIEGK